MPNIKLYVENRLWTARAATITDRLPPLRELLCRELSVPPSACQLAVLPVHGLPDQPPVNAELSILPTPERTRERLLRLAEGIRMLLGEATGETTAVRISTLDPVTYVALK